MKLTKNEIANLCEKEVAYWQNRKENLKDTNANKSIKSAKIVVEMLNCVDEKKVFDLRPIPENKIARDFEMFNLGDCVEMIIKSLITKTRQLKLSKSKTFDTILDETRYEIKASLNASSKNTPINNEKNILFVNQKGVWIIDNHDGQYNGQRLGATVEVGEYADELAEMLGFE